MYYDTKASGDRIRQLRTQRGFTQENVAQILNIDRSFYGRIESGKKGCSVDILVLISSLFETSLDYLILGTEESCLFKMEAVKNLKTDIAELISRLQIFTSKL